MNTEEKLNLIKQNAQEIITQEKLKELLKKKNPVVYCGYEPSGEIHIGHFVTILKLKDLEQAGFKVKILIADWHAWLNKKGDWNTINKQVKIWERAFKKMGLKKPEIIIGTSFQKKPEYMEDVFTLAESSTINRGMRAMQEVARDIEHAKITQIIYPLMQIADMKYLKVDAAIGGMEQRKIHMMALESLKEIKYKTPLFIHTPLIPSLKGPNKGKMSSSDESSLISIKDDQKKIQRKISSAFCPEGKPNPVLDIVRTIIFPVFKKIEIKRSEKFGGNKTYNSYKELEEEFFNKKLHPMDLKKTTGEKLSEIFEKIKD